MNVLSLFDGMSCGQIALDQLGIKVKNYFAAEIDKYAIKVAQANYPDMIHLGDVRDVQTSGDHLMDEFDCGHKIDLLIGGSPCQGFSFAGKQLNFDDPRSQLFFEYVRLLKALKPKYFLLENVRMKKESMDVITEMLGVEPVAINSNLVSAQNRHRLYWTNIPMDGIPEDRGIVLSDILEDGCTDRDKSHCIDANYFKGGNLKSYFEKHRRQLVFSGDGLAHVGDAAEYDHYKNSQIKRVYHPDGKAPTLLASAGGNSEPKILQKGRGWNKGGLKAQNGKTPTLSTSSWQHNNHLTYDEGMTWRKLTPLECERLQTVPEGYTAHVSNTQRYRMLGNGWTVEVIKHIMKGIIQ
jgi:DNA-cytosine methyltransferase